MTRPHLDTLFYEQVNDVGLRRKLRDARGFCNWHAWQARKIASSALGVAIIANDLITDENKGESGNAAQTPIPLCWPCDIEFNALY